MSEIENKSAAKSALLVVFLVVFIDLLGFGIVLPLVPRVAETHLANFSPTWSGIILGSLYSSFSLMQFIFSPMWGRLSDRIGRRPVLLISLIGSTLFYALFAYATTLKNSYWLLALFLISRIGAGIAGASVSTAAAVIADVTPKERRSKAMGLIGAAFGFGFTCGPLIAYAGLRFFNENPWGVGLIASLFSLIALIIAFVKFKETRAPQGETTAKELFSFSKTIEVLRMGKIGPLVLIYFFVIFGFAVFEGTLSLFTKEIFNFDDKENFLVFAYIGFVLCIANGGIYRRVAGKIVESKLIGFGIICLILGIAGLAGIAFARIFMAGSIDAISGMKPLFFLMTAVAVFGFAFINPSISALISKSADPNRQGEVQGVSQSFASLGRILGPFIGLYAFQVDKNRLAPYLISVILLLCVTTLLPLLNPKQQQQQQPTESN